MTEVAAPTIAESIVTAEQAPEAPTESQASVVPEGGQSPEAGDQPKEDEFSSRFAALSRREKYLRDQEAKIKADAEKYKSYADLKDKVKDNPLAVLQEYGLDLDTIISASLGEDAPPPTVEEQLAALREEMAKEKEEASNREKAAKEAEEKAYQESIDEAIVSHKIAIADHISQNTEKYELIKLQNAEDLIWEVTEAHFDNNDGEVLTPEQAADKVEAYLEQQITKAMELSRFKSKTELKSEMQEPGFTISDINPIKPVSPTLTSDLSTTPSDKSSNSHMTDEESRAAAAKLLNWT